VQTAKNPAGAGKSLNSKCNMDLKNGQRICKRVVTAFLQFSLSGAKVLAYENSKEGT
jgi:hypothetical protein